MQYQPEFILSDIENDGHSDTDFGLFPTAIIRGEVLLRPITLVHMLLESEKDTYSEEERST